MRKAVQLVAGLAAALACCAAAAQRPQGQVDREAEDVLAAVVRIKMTAIANARSAATLGATREGTGVVIDERGYIVTIGYIVIEADSIEITTQDDRTFPASLVGYDHASGLALLRSGAPIGPWRRSPKSPKVRLASRT